MEGKIGLIYPDIILYASVISILILFVWRKKKNFKKGVIVANTKYVKSTKYFKMLNAKYHIYTILIKVVCIILILISAILSARLFQIKKHYEEYNNRDIMLCMDFSPSMAILNNDLLQTMSKIVDNLTDERFGLSIWDSGVNNVVPLTTDYNYVKFRLDNLREVFFGNNKKKIESTEDVRNYRQASLAMGLLSKESLRENVANSVKIYNTASRIGDGLAECAKSFNDDNRTKVIIFSTDNLGEGLFITKEEATNYCVKEKIIVYPIGALTIKDDIEVNNGQKPKEGLIKIAEKTGGKYFDYNEYTISRITEEIDNLTANANIKATYTMKEELPDKLFPFLLATIIILFLLDWRVRI